VAGTLPLPRLYQFAIPKGVGHFWLLIRHTPEAVRVSGAVRTDCRLSRLVQFLPEWAVLSPGAVQRTSVNSCNYIAYRPPKGVSSKPPVA